MEEITIKTDCFMSFRNAAKFLGVSHMWVYRHVEQGDIRCIEFDGTRFVVREDIERIKEVREGGRL